MSVLIYDGDCGFCAACVRWGERHLPNWPKAAPFQLLALDHYGLTTEQCQSALHYVDAHGKPHAANHAVGRLLIDSRSPWVVIGRIIELPVARSLAALAYRLIARNRHRLPGATEQCALPAATPSAR